MEYGKSVEPRDRRSQEIADREAMRGAISRKAGRVRGSEIVSATQGSQRVAGKQPLRKDHDAIEREARASLVSPHPLQGKGGLPVQERGVRSVEFSVCVITPVNAD